MKKRLKIDRLIKCIEEAPNCQVHPNFTRAMETSKQTRSKNNATDKNFCDLSFSSPIYDVVALLSPYKFQHAFGCISFHMCVRIERI